ncbi:MAG: cupin domain-containing protein [bacterium]|nr:cupin domain-containing protein [bacterium]
MSGDPMSSGDASSPFRTWNGVEPLEFLPGVHLHAIGGEQVLLCRVSYEPGTTVARHHHEATEQIVVLTSGEMTLTIGDEQRRMTAGDVAVINRGVPHELYSDTGCTFVEALSPVPRDHVPDLNRDLVLGKLSSSLHVER